MYKRQQQHSPFIASSTQSTPLLNPYPIPDDLLLDDDEEDNVAVDDDNEQHNKKNFQTQQPSVNIVNNSETQQLQDKVVTEQYMQRATPLPPLPPANAHNQPNNDNDDDDEQPPPPPPPPLPPVLGL